MENKFDKVKDLSMRLIGIDNPILTNIICIARKIALLKLKIITSILSKGNNGQPTDLKYKCYWFRNVFKTHQMYFKQGNPIQYLQRPILL